MSTGKMRMTCTFDAVKTKPMNQPEIAAVVHYAAQQMGLQMLHCDVDQTDEGFTVDATVLPPDPLPEWITKDVQRWRAEREASRAPDPAEDVRGQHAGSVAGAVLSEVCKSLGLTADRIASIEVDADAESNRCVATLEAKDKPAPKVPIHETNGRAVHQTQT